MTTTSEIPGFLRLALASLSLCLTPFGAARAASIALDTSFNPPAFAAPGYGSRVLLLPSGKFVEYFNVNTLVDQPTGAIMRFLPDGTFDPSFNLSRDIDSVAAAAELPDDLLIISAFQDVYGAYGIVSDAVLRLNNDGSIDPTFNTAGAGTSGSANPLTPTLGGVRAIAIQADNNILLAGFFGAFGGQSFPGIVRLLPDGTLDGSFSPITLQFADGPIEFGLWAAPAVQQDGKILIAGDFTGVDGVDAPGVARLNSDGTLDQTFNATGFTRFSPNRPIRGVVVQDDGKVIVGGQFAVTGGPADVPLVRMNDDGSIDQSYVYPPGGVLFFGRIKNLILQPDGKPIAVGNSVFRFNTDGSLDPGFHMPALLDSSPQDFPLVITINLQPDGRILVGGTFSDVDDGSGISNDDHWGVAQFNPDGTLDPSLTESHQTANRSIVTSGTQQLGGSTLIAFDLTGGQFVPVLPHSFGRLLINGSLDPNFDPVASFSPSGAFGPDFLFTGFNLLADGGLLAFGQRDLSFGSGPFTYGKLFPDVTEDTSYVPNLTDAFSSVHALGDGRALVANYFNLAVNFLINAAQNVVDNTELQRLNADGTLDSSFQLDPSILADTVQRNVDGMITNMAGDGGKIVAVLDDGTILFTYTALDSTARLVRLTADGALDSFFPASTPVSTLATSFTVVDPTTGSTVIVPGITGTTSSTAGFSDGFALPGSQAIVVGGFSSYQGNPAHGIVRLLADGSVDTTFQSGGGAQWTQTTETTTFHPSIDNIEMENDGKFLVSGTFEAYDGVAAPGLATLNPDGSLFEALSRIASRAKFDNFLSRAVLLRQPDGSFYLSGPYVVAGGTEQPSFIHIDSFGGVPIIGSPLIANGVGGQSFTYQIVASGQPTNYSATGLPNGLSVDPPTGLISGVPTVAGSFAVALSATNGEGTGSAILNLTIQPAAAPPVITSASSASAQVGQPFSYQITATNSPSSFGASPLPAGLSVNTSTGLISGTPSATGSFSVTLSATNTAGTGTKTLALSVAPASPVITSSSFATATLGQSFTYQITATNSPTSFNATGLPAGLSVNTVTGLISGTPSVTGSFAVTLSATNSGGTGTKTLSLDVLIPAPVITSPLSATATLSQQFTYQIIATQSPTSYDATNLPIGLSVDSVLGVISGTPTQAGTSQVTLSASNAGGTGTATLTLTVQTAPASNISIISGTTVTGRTGQPFSFQVITSGASSAARLSATRLPAGLILDPVTGLISGTPALDGSFSVTLTVTDGSLTSSETLELTFTSDLAVPVIISPSSANLIPGQPFSYTIVAPSSDPGDPVTFSLIGTLPRGLSFDPVTGTISGVFQSGLALPGGPLLSGGVVSNVQLFATNSHGTATIPLFFVLAPAGAMNISTRLAVGSGDDVLIGGFIVTGNAPKKVIIRALGPSLNVDMVPVPGRLQDTVLELHDTLPDGTDRLLSSDDNWRDSQEQEIIDSTVAPEDPLESAIVATLAPLDAKIAHSGAYTVVVRGKNNATGIGLVEVFDLGTASLDVSSEAKLANISTRGKVQTGDDVMIGGFILGGTAASNVLVRAIGPELTTRGVAGALQDTTLELHDGQGSLLASNDDWRSDQEQEIIDTGVPPLDPRESAIVRSINAGAYTAVVRGKNNSVGVGLVEAYVLP